MGEASLRRRPVTLGVSLKLYLDIARSEQWSRRVADIARHHPAIRDGSVRVFVMPSFPALHAVRDALAGSLVELGAQDLHWEDRGPYTGEVSGADLRYLGCRLVEVGHAERRTLFGEADDVVCRKVAAAVRNGLTPVLCVGEAEEGEIYQAAQACVDQLVSALAGLQADARAELVVAYEPVWAIGRPAPAPLDHISGVAAALRARLARDRRVATSSVIYGGSAQGGMLGELGKSVDGLFLGRFAHDTTDLTRIIDEAGSLR